MLHDSQEDPTMAVFSDILGRVAPDNGNGSTQRSHHTKLHLRGYNPEQFPVAVLKHVAAELQTDTMSFRFQSPVHVQSDSNATGQNQPRSIYVSTAEQIGLLPRSGLGSLCPSVPVLTAVGACCRPGVPDLVTQLLPPRTSVQCRRFWQRWLLNPPMVREIDPSVECRALCAVAILYCICTDTCCICTFQGWVRTPDARRLPNAGSPAVPSSYCIQRADPRGESRHTTQHRTKQRHTFSRGCNCSCLPIPSYCGPLPIAGGFFVFSIACCIGR